MKRLVALILFLAVFAGVCPVWADFDYAILSETKYVNATKMIAAMSGITDPTEKMYVKWLHFVNTNSSDSMKIEGVWAVPGDSSGNNSADNSQMVDGGAVLTAKGTDGHTRSIEFPAPGLILTGPNATIQVQGNLTDWITVTVEGAKE